jgi:hypothetical protein
MVSTQAEDLRADFALKPKNRVDAAFGVGDLPP